MLFVNRASLATEENYRSGSTTAGGGIVLAMQVEYDFPRSPEGIFDLWLPEPSEGEDVLCAQPIDVGA